MKLFLHEVVDIVGENARPYMDHVRGMDAGAVADRGLALFGTWQVVGMTGRWPQVVNLWEVVDGWDGWRRVLTAANVRRETNAALKQWWDEAYVMRSGGFDRLLATRHPLHCPETEVGALLVHEITRVRAGAATDYLDAVVEEWAPVAADHGHRLAGAFEVLMTDTEVVALWATDLEGHVGLQQSHDERIAKWRSRARDYAVQWREELMVP